MGQSFPRATLPDTEARSYPSKIMGVDYQISAWMPPSYAAGDRKFPVIYLLDGDLFFGLVSGIVSGMVWGQVIPECMVVGIGHEINNIDEWWRYRAVDLNPPENPKTTYPEWMKPFQTRRAPDFLNCLNSELIPFIETTYRVDPTERCLAGYSWGGQFVIYTLFHEAELFQRYFIGSGFWEHMLPDYASYIDRFTQRELPRPVSAFFSVCSLEDDQYPYFPKFLDMLARHKQDGFRYQSVVLEGENHSSGMAEAYRRGLRALLSSN